jgi:2-haloacid dehalogenase
MAVMQPTILCDVNETLLDLAPVRAEFGRICGDRSLAGTWFAQLLKLAFVATITGSYQPFPDLGAAAFDMVAESGGITPKATDRAAVVAALGSLPAHPDATTGLRTLDEAGFRIAALTNSPRLVAEEQLAGAGLASHFERIMSVDMVGTFKPAAATYLAAIEELGTVPQETVMVAAHDWDIAGAMTAGLVGAFVARPGQVLSPLQPPPAFIGPDFAAVAGALIEADWRGDGTFSPGTEPSSGVR